MTLSRYHLTKTALEHFEKIIRDTASKWGVIQAEAYRDILLDGFQEIAENHKTIHTGHREELAGDTNFSVHLVCHHYVVFKNLDDHDTVISGLFHERMNIPARLKELVGSK